MHAAAFCGDLEMVQVLLDYGLDINVKDNHGFTPLSRASQKGFKNAGVARLLLDHGADPNVRTRRSGRGSTPLHLAVEDGEVEIARLLLERGASVEAQDEQRRTPVDVASGERCDELITLLLEHRAK